MLPAAFHYANHRIKIYFMWLQNKFVYTIIINGTVHLCIYCRMCSCTATKVNCIQNWRCKNDFALLFENKREGKKMSKTTHS